MFPGLVALDEERRGVTVRLRARLGEEAQAVLDTCRLPVVREEQDGACVVGEACIADTDHSGRVELQRIRSCDETCVVTASTPLVDMPALRY